MSEPKLPTQREALRAKWEAQARCFFESYCLSGIRPLLYNLTQLAGGEYASHHTQEAWLNYRKGFFDGRGDI